MNVGHARWLLHLLLLLESIGPISGIERLLLL